MSVPVNPGKPIVAPVSQQQPQKNTYTISLGEALAALGIPTTEVFNSLEIVGANLILETTVSIA